MDSVKKVEVRKAVENMKNEKIIGPDKTATRTKKCVAKIAVGCPTNLDNIIQGETIP